MKSNESMFNQFMRDLFIGILGGLVPSSFIIAFSYFKNQNQPMNLVLFSSFLITLIVLIVVISFGWWGIKKIYSIKERENNRFYTEKAIR